MLLTTVVAKGATGGLAASEEVTEQLALVRPSPVCERCAWDATLTRSRRTCSLHQVLEIMDYHCGECASLPFSVSLS